MSEAINRLGIEMLTLLGMPPVEHVELAAELGCVSISTGLMRLPLSRFGREDIYPDWSLLEDAALRRELKAALTDNGVHIGLGEGFRVSPEGNVRDFASQLDIFAELDTLRINAISTEPDVARAHDEFAVLAQMVKERGMQFIVEFAPPQALNTVEGALAVVAHVGHENCAMMLDSMHFFRSGGTVEQIAQLPVAYAQLADVPLSGGDTSYLDEAMFGRLIPGAGELPLRDWIAALPADCEIGIEVPNWSRISSMGARAHAAEAVKAARALGA